MQDISEVDSLGDDADRMRELLIALGRRRPLRDPISTTMDEMELTPPQLHALLWLGHDGPLTMGDLARRSGITEKTITGVVDRLERLGLAERVRGEADRRVVRARLTRKGSNTYRRIDGLMREKLQRLLSRLDAADRRDLFRIIGNLLASLAADSKEHTP